MTVSVGYRSMCVHKAQHVLHQKTKIACQYAAMQVCSPHDTLNASLQHALQIRDIQI